MPGTDSWRGAPGLHSHAARGNEGGSSTQVFCNRGMANMKVDKGLATRALAAARSGWYRYLSILWTLNLLLVLDFMTGQEFWSDKGTIRRSQA